MGANNLVNGVNVDRARAERDERVNPAAYAPGQDEDLDDLFDDDDFGDSVDVSGSTFSQVSSLGGTDANGISQGTTPVGAWGGGLGMSMQQGGLGQGQFGQPVDNRSMEDKVWDTAISAGKGTVSWMKDFVASFKEVTPKFWSSYGSRTFVVGGVVAVAGVIVRLFGVQQGVNFIVSGLVSSGIGAVVLMSSIDKAKSYTSKYKDGSSATQQSGMGQFPNQLDTGLGGESDFSDEGDTDFDDGDDWGSDDDWDDEEGSTYEASAAGDEDNDSSGSSLFGSGGSIFGGMSTAAQNNQSMSIDEAIDTMQEVPRGMYTRQYLYDMFVKVLKNIKPDFSNVKTINQDSDVFVAWESYLREAASISGVKDDNLPNLDTLEETLFTIKLSFKRSAGCNVDKVGDELAKIYAYYSNITDGSVYARTATVGKTCIVTIYTGESAIISLKDMYAHCKDFVLNSDKYMPVVIGIDARGEVKYLDFKSVESLLVAGMPRSGKSWFVKAVLMQMCAFLSPRELEFVCCDPKDTISDFRDFRLPHVKKFISTDAGILAELRRIVKVEAPKRKKQISDAGCINIWDYKKKCPDVDLPLKYILIDEVVTLAERMDKETKAEFQGLLTEIISQLPALGIRIFMIPHLIKNEIIAKTTTDLIPCRISVRGNPAHIETTTGDKRFGYKLTKMGDMAVNMVQLSTQVEYIHAVAASDSNEGYAEIFEYLRRMWSKLEPDTVAGSRADMSADDKTTTVDGAVTNSSTPVQSKTVTTANTRKSDSTVSHVSKAESSVDSFDLFGDDEDLDEMDMTGAFTEPNSSGLSGVSGVSHTQAQTEAPKVKKANSSGDGDGSSGDDNIVNDIDDTVSDVDSSNVDFSNVSDGSEFGDFGQNDLFDML